MKDSLTRLTAAMADRYRIEREIGQGGTATVYLAEDLRHRRKVAVKVLRPELAAILGGERFLKEIAVTANLHHPNILPLYDSGEADGFLFYVMPFIDGESLRAKIDREKQLGVEDAVRIARSVAAALDYAHRQEVIHRDIKPENVMLYEGQAMVADFGIALAVSQAGGARITETGLSIGTPHYMSPEQAAAERDLDGRTDIYSLGAMTFEMLAGRPPFEAATLQSVVSKILTEPARPVSRDRPGVPANVDAAVHVALSKLPADRFPSAARFAEALGNPAFAIPADRPPAANGSKVSAAERWVWLAMTIASLAVAWLGWNRRSASRTVERLFFVLPDSQRLAVRGGFSYPIDISPDGARLVYVAESGGGTQLALRNLDSFEVKLLEGTASARQPFFSPDGEWVGFFANDQLLRVPVNGGAPIPIAAAPGPSGGADWGPDDRILFSAGGRLFQVAAAGSGPTPLALQPDSTGIYNPRWPHILPDGKHALVTGYPKSGGSDQLARIVAFDLTTGETRDVIAGSQARYLPTGHLIFHAGQERIRAVPFDPARLAVTGAEIPVLENVFRGPAAGAANFAVAAKAGTLLYVQGSFNRSLVLVDRNGRESAVPAQSRGYRFPRVSPDGRHVALQVDPRPSDLWIVDLQRGTGERQETPAHDGWGVWSPDGRRIAFLADADLLAGADLLAWREYPFVADPIPVRLQRDSLTVANGVSNTYYPKSWTRDDHLIGYGSSAGTDSGTDILSVAIGDGAVTPLLATPSLETNPAVSPDGRWIAFDSDLSGVPEVYVHGFPKLGERHAISIGGGVEPVWSWDGSELYYRRGNSIMAVPVRTGPSFEILGEAEPLFFGLYDFTQDGNWAVLPDGRFLMIRGDPTTTTRFQLVLNWFEELRNPSGR